jgi:hypothetical protein
MPKIMIMPITVSMFFNGASLSYVVSFAANHLPIETNLPHDPNLATA